MTEEDKSVVLENLDDAEGTAGFANEAEHQSPAPASVHSATEYPAYTPEPIARDRIR
jgi:hypothetical protein